MNAERVYRALVRFGAPVAAHGVTADDFRQPGTVYQMIFFDSAEEAERNNGLEVTQTAAEDFGALVGDVEFTDLDLILDRTV